MVRGYSRGCSQTEDYILFMVKVPELPHPTVLPPSDQLPVMVLLLSVPEKLSELLPLVPEPD